MERGCYGPQHPGGVLEMQDLRPFSRHLLDPSFWRGAPRESVSFRAAEAGGVLADAVLGSLEKNREQDSRCGLLSPHVHAQSPLLLVILGMAGIDLNVWGVSAGVGVVPPLVDTLRGCSKEGIRVH